MLPEQVQTWGEFAGRQVTQQDMDYCCRNGFNMSASMCLQRQRTQHDSLSLYCCSAVCSAACLQPSCHCLLPAAAALPCPITTCCVSILTGH
jgi:hypothetical protein